MKSQTVLILFSLVALASAIIPLASAQETGNMLTDGISWATDGLGNLWNQASTFVSEQPVATGAIGTTGGIAGVAGIGWKLASSAKSKLKSAYDSLSGQVESLQSKASSATEQLTAYKSQTETQLSTLQTDVQKQVEAAKAQASTATGQLNGLQTQMETLAQQKASYQNQVEELTARLKTATDQLAVLTPKIK